MFLAPHFIQLQAVGYVNTAAVRALVEFDESLASDVDRVEHWTAKDFAEEHRFADMENVLGDFRNAVRNWEEF